MKLNTRNFGEIEIDESSIINFPNGIPGFEKEKRYIIINNPDKENPFQWLQSVDNQDLAFVVINPFFVKVDYDIVLPESAIETLKIKDEEDVALYTIVVIPENIEEMTTNLSGPIVVNVKEKLGKQIVLDDSRYSTKHYIFKKELNSEGA
ncbi:flagellar assembly protein FliW [Anaerosalibacter bizertensis]|uniref:Flagellar assembly factor FliW n=1 Tax=Anaerosalibacter bizertensis TaxID=932217 RepID=A0A844FH46_9FIRM|nr:flagellar assembly protein FliW [Anaerosalibacter bizertensis]MSS43319.1 flagellar assembly protein FliW [Anaerosalibacter bizertensis]